MKELKFTDVIKKMRNKDLNCIQKLQHSTRTLPYKAWLSFISVRGRSYNTLACCRKSGVESKKVSGKLIFTYRPATARAAITFLHYYTASICKPNHMLFHLMDCYHLTALQCITCSMLNCFFSLSPYLIVNTLIYKNCFFATSTHLTENTQPTNMFCKNIALVKGSQTVCLAI